MGLVRQTLSSAFGSEEDYGHIRSLLNQECGIPKKHINDIRRHQLEDDLPRYTVQFNTGFMSERYLEEFLYYNESYENGSESDQIVIKRVGESGSYSVDRIDSFPYELEIEYFKEGEFRSETKSRMSFLTSYSQYRKKGQFKFTDV